MSISYAIPSDRLSVIPTDFRKDNIQCMESVFKAFNRYCLKLKILSKSFISIDGSKFKAVNAKDRNFTLNKLDDRLAWLDSNIKHYLSALEEADNDDNDRNLTREEIGVYYEKQEPAQNVL